MIKMYFDSDAIARLAFYADQTTTLMELSKRDTLSVCVASVVGKMEFELEDRFELENYDEAEAVQILKKLIRGTVNPNVHEQYRLN